MRDLDELVELARTAPAQPDLACVYQDCPGGMKLGAAAFYEVAREDLPEMAAELARARDQLDAARLELTSANARAEHAEACNLTHADAYRAVVAELDAARLEVASVRLDLRELRAAAEYEVAESGCGGNGDAEHDATCLCGVLKAVPRG